MGRVEVIGSATLYLGDCRDILPNLPRVDAVITDPPYSERTHKGHDASASGHAGAGRDGAKRSELGYDAMTEADMADYAKNIVGVCSGWIVTMTDHVLAPSLQRYLEGAGRYVFAPLPFYAPGSRVQLSEDGPSSWTVWIVVARTAAQSKWGTLPGGYVAGPGWREREHMGGKPTALMDRLIEDYSRSGQTVLDPYMGSGTTGVSCFNIGRKFVGIERETKYFDIACRRIEDAQRQQRMF